MGRDDSSWGDAPVQTGKINWEEGGGAMPGRDQPQAPAGNPYDQLQPEVLPEGDEPATNVIDAAAIDGYPKASGDELPDWVKVPSGLVIPPGVVIGYLRFRAEWTVAEHLGDRQCILWPLTPQDEQVGYMRIRDVNANAVAILAQHQIRAIDGHKVTWDAAALKHPANVYNFWRDIGPKCRQMIIRWYHQSHALDVGETADFFEHCVAVRSSVLVTS
jgi:hypothetical protein